ncbi:MAG: hypothetical protein NC226_12055 [Bacteroides cellulosilyticus]|nr:hypothetical protein [Bacteroides cellulosilyticus]
MAVVGTNDWRAIAYGNGKYVAVGTEGYATTSIDGENWTIPKKVYGDTVINKNQLNDIIFVDGVFVTAGNDPYVYASDDGVTWTRKGYIFGAATKISCIAYGNGIYVAGQYNGSGSIAYSYDCITWVRVSTAYIGASSIIFANGRFVCVGTSCTAVSSDGIQWDTIAHTSSCIAYGNGRYVTAYGTNSYTSVNLTEFDGPFTMPANWNSSYSNSYRDIVFKDGVFIAVGDRSSVCTSVDGQSWKAIQQIEGDVSKNLYGIVVAQ